MLRSSSQTRCTPWCFAILVDERLRDVPPPAACHWCLHRQASGVPRHANERCECIPFPLLVGCAPSERPSKLDPTISSSLSSVRPRKVPTAQRGSSYAISPRTILKSTVSPIYASRLSHSFPLSRAHALRPSSRLMYLLSTYAACRTSHGRMMLLLSTL